MHEICDLCFKDVEYVGDLTKYYFVARRGAKYLLMAPPAHRYDDLIEFTVTPRPDPVTSEIEALCESYEHSHLPIPDSITDVFADGMIWNVVARTQIARMPKQDMRGTYLMVMDMIEAGYNPKKHGDAELWLYNRIGEVIRDYEGNTATPASVVPDVTTESLS